MQKNSLKGEHLVIVFWDLGIGGIQTRMKDIVSETVKRGGKVTVLVERRSEEEIEFVKSKRISIFNFRSDKYEELKRPFRRLERFRFLFWIIFYVYKCRPNKVLVFLNRFSVFLVIIRKLLSFGGRNFRLILNEGILTTKYLKQYEHFHWNNWVKWAYPKADVIIVPTKAIELDLENNFGVPKNKIKVIPSWVNVKLREQEKIYDGVYVGRLSPEKGIETLVMLAKKMMSLKKYKIAVVGDGVMKEWLIKEIDNNKLQKAIDFLGYLPHEQTLKVVARSRVLLLPSRNEGLPMTVLEANALGVPAIVMPFDGVDEVVINNETGIITKMNDDDYLNKTLDVLGKPDLIKKMGNKAKMRVQEFHSKRNLDEFMNTIFNNDWFLAKS